MRLEVDEEDGMEVVEETCDVEVLDDEVDFENDFSLTVEELELDDDEGTGALLPLESVVAFSMAEAACSVEDALDSHLGTWESADTYDLVVPRLAVKKAVPADFLSRLMGFRGPDKAADGDLVEIIMLSHCEAVA